MVSEHSGRGVSISLLFVHKIYSCRFIFCFDQSVLVCLFSLDLLVSLSGLLDLFVSCLILIDLRISIKF